MDKFKKCFNFDNIGTKIKNFAKWTCWIEIVLVWIAAIITFFVLICDDWTAYLCWIPLVSAIVAPFLIWIGSWILYAFGEMVEKISKTNDIAEKIELNTRNSIITSEGNLEASKNNNYINKVLQKEIKKSSESTDNIDRKKLSVIVYNICNNDKCSRCGNIEEVYTSEIIKPYGKAHQRLCKECLNKYEQEEYVIIKK